jgi:hypothetical protein
MGLQHQFLFRLTSRVPEKDLDVSKQGSSLHRLPRGQEEKKNDRKTIFDI